MIAVESIDLTDERLGLPSASSIEADANCHGRHAACAGLPEKPSDDAAFGTRVHAGLAIVARGGSIDDLSGAGYTPEEIDAIEELWSKARRLVDWWRADIAPDSEGTTLLVEVRMLFRGAGLVPRFTGQPDLVLVCGAEALVIDYKSMPGGKVAESHSNYQLASLAVLIRDNHPEVRRVHAAIIQRMKGKPEVVVYEAADLDAAQERVLQVIDAAMVDGAARTPGEVQCRYCRACTTERCPESTASALAVPEEHGAVDARSYVDSLSIDQLAPFWDRIAFAQSVLGTLKASIEARVQADPEGVPGLGLKLGATRRKVEDVQALFGRCTALGVSQADFVACCTVTMKDLDSVLRKATGLRGKELDDAKAKALEGIVTETVSKASVVRKEAA